MSAPARLPISVCLIAGNEAARIHRALKSVSDWTSEIIVVLNEEVSDGTDRIAEYYGAKVFREPWKGYMAQKNSAAEKVTQPWVLSLDADEEVSPALAIEIKVALAKPTDAAAFSFPRCTNFCGRWIRHGDWYPDRKTRLWKRGQAHWQGGQVHEKLEVTGATRRLRADLLHHTAETMDHQIAKIAGYSDGFALEVQANQQHVGWLDFLFRPVWRFVRAYFLRLGFLDGWQGYYIAWMTGFYTATRYAKALVASADKEMDR